MNRLKIYKSSEGDSRHPKFSCGLIIHSREFREASQFTSHATILLTTQPSTSLQPAWLQVLPGQRANRPIYRPYSPLHSMLGGSTIISRLLRLVKFDKALLR